MEFMPICTFENKVPQLGARVFVAANYVNYKNRHLADGGASDAATQFAASQEDR